MVRVNPNPEEYNYQTPKESAQPVKHENSVWAKFNDTDGKVDLNDVQYENGCEQSNAITSFLKKYQNMKWTETLTNKVTQLIEEYNNSKQEGRVIVATAQVAKPLTTGGVYATLNEDGTTTVHRQGQPDVIYDADGNEITQKETTPEVKTRNVSKNGVSGTYKFKEKDGSYELTMQMNVSIMNNKNAQVFLKGSNDLVGSSNSAIKQDSSGNYTFRGIKARTHSALKQKLLSIAQQIAINTEIHNDIKQREANGETLTPGEKNFIQKFSRMLEKYGLHLDNEGNVVE